MDWVTTFGPGLVNVADTNCPAASSVPSLSKSQPYDTGFNTGSGLGTLASKSTFTVSQPEPGLNEKNAFPPGEAKTSNSRGRGTGSH